MIRRFSGGFSEGQGEILASQVIRHFHQVVHELKVLIEKFKGILLLFAPAPGFLTESTKVPPLLLTHSHHKTRGLNLGISADTQVAFLLRTGLGGVTLITKVTSLGNEHPLLPLLVDLHLLQQQVTARYASACHTLTLLDHLALNHETLLRSTKG